MRDGSKAAIIFCAAFGTFAVGVMTILRLCVLGAEKLVQLANS